MSVSKILECCAMWLFRVGTSMHNACMHYTKAVVHGGPIVTVQACTEAMVRACTVARVHAYYDYSKCMY